MHHYAKKTVAVGFLVFLALWIFGTVRALTLPYPPPMDFIPSYSESRVHVANYANNLRQFGLAEKALPLVLDNPNVEQIRVHEKRAELASGTDDFQGDSAKIDDAVKSHQAEIISEDKSGIEPKRRLVLAIGVDPDKFDDLVEKLRGIGQLSSINIEQKDRTGEFRKLHAQRQALKKYLESIVKLREGNPKDRLGLEQKIYDIEKDLQNLSVQFGEFLGKQSYYQVSLSLVEYQAGDRRDRTYTIWQRIGDGFVWAIAWWFAAALALGLVIATAVSVRVLRQKPAGPDEAICGEPASADAFLS